MQQNKNNLLEPSGKNGRVEGVCNSRVWCVRERDGRNRDIGEA